MEHFLKELRRRNVFRVAIAYLFLGWVVTQVAAILAPALLLPDWTMTLVVFIGIVGFPFALLFAWAYELTPEGLKPSGDVDPQESVTRKTGQRLNYIIIALLALALTATILDAYVLGVRTGAEQAPPDLPTTWSSIAVVPFVDMSEDGTHEYFSDGISEEILNLLAKTGTLRVAARTSSFAFKNDNQDMRKIGEALNVEAVLEGSVRRSGTRLRITAQLIDVKTGFHLWSETYDREVADVFDTQDEISHEILNALLVLSGRENLTLPKSRKTSLEAHEQYLLGRHYFEKRTGNDLKKARGFFEKAIEFDLNYAPAYSGLADTHMLSWNYGGANKREVNDLARPLIETALAIDPSHAEAYVSKCLLLERLGSIDESLAACSKAIDLNPNLARAYHWKGNVLLRQKRFREFEEAIDKAYELDPHAAVIIWNITIRYIYAHNLAGVEEWVRRLETRAPEAHERIAEANLILSNLRGNWADSFRATERAAKRDGSKSFYDMLSWSYWTLNEPMPAADVKRGGLVAPINSSLISDAITVEDTLMSITQSERNSENWPEAKGYLTFQKRRYSENLDAWESIPGFYDEFSGRAFCCPNDLARTTFTAWSHRQMGNEVRANELIAMSERYLSHLKAGGIRQAIPIFNARIHALKKEEEAAVKALRRQFEEQSLPWRRLSEPIFDDLRDREDFKALEAEVRAHLNAERAKLGWAPVEK